MINIPIYYGCVSQGLGTTKFTNVDIDCGLDFPI